MLLDPAACNAVYELLAWLIAVVMTRAFLYVYSSMLSITSKLNVEKKTRILYSRVRICPYSSCRRDQLPQLKRRNQLPCHDFPPPPDQIPQNIWLWGPNFAEKNGPCMLNLVPLPWNDNYSVAVMFPV